MASLNLKPDNGLAAHFKSLHIPGDPVILTNIYDPSSTNALLELNNDDRKIVKAVATTSYGVAEALGVRDDELTLDLHLSMLSQISPIVRASHLPLTADLQDGHYPKVDECIRKAVGELGIVGANIEDCMPGWDYSGGVETLRPLAEQVAILKQVLTVAAECGVPEFVVNARTDAMRVKNADIDEAIRRGKAYLAAGATSVFVFGGSQRGLSRDEVKRLVKEFDGRLAVRLSEWEDGMSVRDVAELGVNRISVGRTLWAQSMAAFKKSAKRILEGGVLNAG